MLGCASHGCAGGGREGGHDGTLNPTLPKPGQSSGQVSEPQQERSDNLAQRNLDAQTKAWRTLLFSRHAATEEGPVEQVAGTEVGVTEPEATFSACFGGAFLMWHPMKYASMLAEKMGRHGTTAWLVNTGCAPGTHLV